MIGVLGSSASGYLADMSWRDDTPAEIQDDLDRLTDEALQAAQHLLDKNGEFYPFAICLDEDGSSRMVGAYDGDEHPPSQDVLELLYRGIAQERDGVRAAAFAAMVEVGGARRTPHLGMRRQVSAVCSAS